jgi:hypothetical protein
VDHLSQPLILIGAGQCGCSLLGEMLAAHPRVRMLGEMAFTVAELWDCFWNAPAAVLDRCRRRAAALARRDEEAALGRLRMEEERERERIGGIVRQALDQALALSRKEAPADCWAFKETWVPPAGHPGWEGHDAVFPGALYVHLVRHPFETARSWTGWQRAPLTLAALRTQLAGWVDSVRANRARAATGRYVCLRCESLVANPRAALAPLLTRLGLPWVGACLAALQPGHAPAGWRSPLPAGATALAAEVPHLAELMAEFDYRVPTAGAEPGGVDPCRRLFTTFVSLETQENVS